MAQPVSCDDNEEQDFSLQVCNRSYACSEDGDDPSLCSCDCGPYTRNLTSKHHPLPNDPETHPPCSGEDMANLRQRICVEFVQDIWTQIDSAMSGINSLTSYMSSGEIDGLTHNNNKLRERALRGKKLLKRIRTRPLTQTNRRSVPGKGTRLPQKPRRKICRYKQVLFHANIIQSTEGLVAPSLSVSTIAASSNSALQNELSSGMTPQLKTSQWLTHDLCRASKLSDSCKPNALQQHGVQDSHTVSPDSDTDSCVDSETQSDGIQDSHSVSLNSDTDSGVDCDSNKDSHSISPGSDADSDVDSQTHCDGNEDSHSVSPGSDADSDVDRETQSHSTEDSHRVSPDSNTDSGVDSETQSASIEDNHSVSLDSDADSGVDSETQRVAFSSDSVCRPHDGTVSSSNSCIHDLNSAGSDVSAGDKAGGSSSCDNTTVEDTNHPCVTCGVSDKCASVQQKLVSLSDEQWSGPGEALAEEAGRNKKMRRSNIALLNNTSQEVHRAIKALEQTSHLLQSQSSDLGDSKNEEKADVDDKWAKEKDEWCLSVYVGQLGQFAPLPRQDPVITLPMLGLPLGPNKHHQYQQQQQSAPRAVNDDVRQEWHRLASFYQYNLPEYVYVIRLAKAGFFLPAEYLASSGSNNNNESAQVQCAFCAVRVPLVKFRDRNPRHVHREESPRCSFIIGVEVGNVSVAEVAQTLGAEFLQKYSVPYRPPPGAGTALPPRNRMLLTTDGEAPAAEEPAFGGSSLASHKPAGESFHSAVAAHSLPPAVAPARTEASGGTTGSQQQQTAGVGRDLADARSEFPYQTAVFNSHQESAPNPVPLGTATAASRQPVPLERDSAAHNPQTPASQGAAGNQVVNNYQTATAAPVGSGGTAREAPPASAAEQQTGQEQQRAGRNVGGDNAQDNRLLVTYEELGIYSQRPKRPDMAVKQVRLNTFGSWPHNASHPRESMAEAGFYFTGHADLVRCFFCKGGLKTWESSDKPWVEHSRWFPRCPFLKLSKGPLYVKAVQNLNNPETRPTIREEAVWAEMQRMEEAERGNYESTSGVVLLANDLAFQAAADPLDIVLARNGIEVVTDVDTDVSERQLQVVAQHLEEENETLGDRCLMCLMNPVGVLFLPCGHLISCAECAPALRTCAICRQTVKGSVRVLMDTDPETEDIGGTEQPVLAAGNS